MEDARRGGGDVAYRVGLQCQSFLLYLLPLLDELCHLEGAVEGGAQQAQQREVQGDYPGQAAIGALAGVAHAVDL